MFVILIFFVILFIIFIFFGNKKDEYSIYENFISEDEKLELIRCKKLLKSNKLNLSSFKNSKSVVYYIKDLEYFYKMCESKNIQKLYNVFELIIRNAPKKGNYYIVNLLEIEPIDSKQQKCYNPNLHYDDTIMDILPKPADARMIKNNNYFNPEVVSVLYICKDKCFNGGELDLFKGPDLSNPLLGNNLIKSVNVTDRNLVYFSGDYYHGVKSYSTENCKENVESRFSLVIEIYYVDERILELLPNKEK